MMVVMVICTTIERNVFCGGPRKIIPASHDEIKEKLKMFNDMAQMPLKVTKGII